jgi:hypothetical protein
MTIRVQAGDVGFTRSNTLLGKAIRWVDVSPDGRPTWTNHQLLFTRAGAVGPRAVEDQAWAVEAQWRVEHNPWWDRHGHEAGNRIRVFRPLFLANATDAGAIVANALAHKGAKYGYWKLGAHALDRVLFGGRKRISSLLFLDSRPICSYLVADAYAEEGYPRAFGGDAQGVSPDSGLDYCEETSYGAAPLWGYVGEVEVPA